MKRAEDLVSFLFSLQEQLESPFMNVMLCYSLTNTVCNSPYGAALKITAISRYCLPEQHTSFFLVIPIY